MNEMDIGHSSSSFVEDSVRHPALSTAGNEMEETE